MSNYKKYILAGIITGIVFRIIHILSMTSGPLYDIPLIDSAYYLNWAKTIAAGDIIGKDVFFMSPLYPYLMAVVFTVKSASPVTIVVIQALLSAVTLYLIGNITLKTGGETVSALAVWIGAFFPVWIYFDGMILTASLILLLNTASVWLLIKWKESNKSLFILLAGVFTGLSALARPSAFIFGFVMFIWVFLQDKRSVLFWIIGITAAILPAAVHNFSVSGEFIPLTSSGGMNFYVGNNPQADGLYNQPDFLASAEPEFEYFDYRLQAERLSGLKNMSPGQVSGFWFHEGIKFILENPSRYLKLCWNKFFYFWNNLEAPNNVSIYFVEKMSPVIRIIPFGFGLLAAGSLAGILFIRRNHAITILLLYLLYLLLANLLFFNSSEFRFPAVVAVIPIFSLFTVKLLESIKSRRLNWFQPVVFMFFLTFAYFQTQTAHLLKSPRMDYFNYGSVALANSDYMNAEKFLLASLAEDPGFQDAHLALGTVYFDTGRYALAVREYSAAGFIVTEEELRDGNTGASSDNKKGAFYAP